MNGRSHSGYSGLRGPGIRGLLICLVGASLGILVNAVSPRGLPLWGPVPVRDTAGIGEVGLQEAWGLYQERQGLFVDARSRAEFRAGRIPGALLLSLDTFQETVSSWRGLIPSDTLLIAYCSSAGCESSWEVALLLKEEGYSRVMVFQGGWEDWKGAGYPMETAQHKGTERQVDSRLPSNRDVSRTEGG